MDYTAAHLLEQMRDRLRERGGELLFSGMPSHLPSRPDIEGYLDELGLVQGDGVRVFETRDSAIEWMEERLLEAAGWQAPEETAPLPLAQMELLAGLDPTEIDVLAGVVVDRSVPAGGRVCSQGDPGDQIFLVRRGRLSALLPLEGGKHHHLATFCAGDFCGEIAFLDRQLRSADIEAVTPASLSVLSRERLDHLLQISPALGSKIYERLASVVSHRLRIADTELRTLEQR